jgi:5-methylthioadenosine/S-adenosylhomocysteine deaminase
MQQLIRAEYLVADPGQLADGVIHDAALVIDDGTVVAAGTWSELKAQFGHLTQIGGPDGWLVLPGLTNAHHHGSGVDGPLAGMPDRPLELWIPSFLLLGSLDPYLDCLLTVGRMLRAGVTSSIHFFSPFGPVEAYGRYVETQLRAYCQTGARVSVALGAVDQQHLTYVPQAEWLASLPAGLRAQAHEFYGLGSLYFPNDDYFALFHGLRGKYGGTDSRVRLLLGPTGLTWLSDELMGRLAETATCHNTGLHMHGMETIYQREYAWRRFGASTADVLSRFGLLGPHSSIAHAIWATESDLEILADRGSTVVTNSSSNLRLGSGLFPLNAARERGVHVAVGMDSLSLFGDDDLFKEMRLVSTLHREPGLDRLWPTPYEVLRMATVEGARAACLDGQVGRLLPGYQADVTVLSLRRIRASYLHPAVDEVAVALDLAQASDVETVLVGGEPVVEGGKLIHVDLAEVERELGDQVDPAEADRHAARLAFLGAYWAHIKARLGPWVPDRLEPFCARNSRI